VQLKFTFNPKVASRTRSGSLYRHPALGQPLPVPEVLRPSLHTRESTREVFSDSSSQRGSAGASASRGNLSEMPILGLRVEAQKLVF